MHLHPSTQEHRWVRAAAARDLPEGGRLAVEVEGKPLALFHTGGRVFAIENRCPHQDAPLDDGTLEGSRITCRWHGWCFELDPSREGRGILPGVDRYHARIAGDDVLVALAAPRR